MKTRYWKTKQGMLMRSTGNVGVKDGEEISKSKYYKELKEQKRMSQELEEDGFTIDSDGVMWMRF